MLALLTMELKQSQRMAQTQQLRMTPQLQQSIKLLQLSTLELATFVEEQLLENPALELVDHESQSSDGAGDASKDGDFTGESQREHDASSEPDGSDYEARDFDDYGDYGNEFSSHDSVDGMRDETYELPSPSQEGQSEASEATERTLEEIVADYAENSNDYALQEQRLHDNDDDRPSYDQMLSRRSTLEEHLLRQLELEHLQDDERLIATLLIQNLNDDGYLEEGAIDFTAEKTEASQEDIEFILTEVVQKLDPVGVGARSLKECLLIQARYHFPRDEMVHALLERHTENLERKNIAPILKDLDCDMEDLKGAMELLRELEPKPARNFLSEADSGSIYIPTPDVYIIRRGDDYVVELNDSGLPRLRISKFYSEGVTHGTFKNEAKEYVQGHVKSAEWLCRSIEQRQATIRKVTESIARFQRDFLDKGPEFLRPLVLREVAEDIGMHESTVSRVTTNKWVDTPQGLRELKYFFNSRIQANDGEDLASESIKQKIRKYIGEEDPKKPLSDQKLCDLLEQEGMKIARRTVAKYREEMKILPSSERKQFI